MYCFLRRQQYPKYYYFSYLHSFYLRCLYLHTIKTFDKGSKIGIQNLIVSFKCICTPHVDYICRTIPCIIIEISFVIIAIVSAIPTIIFSCEINGLVLLLCVIVYIIVDNR